MSKKSRKLIRSGTAPGPDAAPQEAPLAVEDPYAAFADRDWGFAFLPAEEPEVVDEGALHALVKQWRHGRATRTIRQALSDAYFTLFVVVVVGAMVANVIVTSQADAATCVTAECQAGRALVPWAVHFAAGALALAVARLFGPVLASAAEGFWLLDAPLSRARLLRARLWGVIGGAFAAAALVAAVVAALAGVAAPTVAGWALATGTWAGALMAWAAVDQSTERVLPGRLAQAASGALAAASVVALVGVAAGWWPPPATTGSGWLPWALAATGVLAAVALGVVAHRRLELLRRSRVTSGGSLVSGMQGAMFALDLGLVRDILVDREAVARGHVRPTRGRWVGARALVWRDLQRLVRYPKPLVGLVAAALVPYVTDPLGLGLLDPLVAALVLMAALIPFLGSLRVLSRTRGLARTFPLATSAIRSATMTVPAVLALVWAVAVVPATAGLTGGVARPPVDAALVALSSAAAGLLGAVRWQTAQPVDFGVPMLATGAGALPPTLVFNLVRGIDIVALVTAPLLLGASPWWSLGIAGGVFLLLRQGFNMAEMAEEAKEQQRLVETEKARASQARVRVPRPGR